MQDGSSSELAVSQEIVDKARDNIGSRKAGWVVFSGKMVSGKDTIAPLSLPAIGFTNVARIGFSDVIKPELELAYKIASKFLSTGLESSVARQIGEELNLGDAAAAEFAAILFPEAKAGRTDAWARTETNRLLLQKLGIEWRTDDLGYWSRATSRASLELLSKSISVYLTGARFEVDVVYPQLAGAQIIRLDVLRKTQLARLKARDGLAPDVEVLEHLSETALDDWAFFNFRTSNDGELQECLDKVTGHLKTVF